MGAAKNIVVVLDPGHDDTHAGARRNGLEEEDLTLKIAQYCKAELSQYNGVTVYMTRESGACANGGGAVTSTECNAKRVGTERWSKCLCQHAYQCRRWKWCRDFLPEPELPFRSWNNRT